MLLVAVTTAVAGPAAAQSRPSASTAAVSRQIDLNSASRDQLMELDGIGEVRADAIIMARPFRTKAELVERWIIPESLYDEIADKVMVRAAPAASPPASVRPAAPRR